MDICLFSMAAQLQFSHVPFILNGMLPKVKHEDLYTDVKAIAPRPKIPRQIVVGQNAFNMKLGAGVGANLVSRLILPRIIIFVGASSAVFGLFAISVFVKISWDWRKILEVEVLILGQFIIEKVMEATQASTQVGSSISRGFPLENINHIAHFSSALLGVTLIWLASILALQSILVTIQFKATIATRSHAYLGL
eukprot:Gb_11769 [translate_table: standard]